MSALTPVDDEILSLIRSTSFEEASGALAACWQSYLPDCAALLGARIREIPEEFWGSDPELLLALGSSHRAPPVSNPFAALAFMEAAETSLPARRSTARPDLEVLIALGRARALRGVGRLVDARAAVATARESLAPAGLGVLARLELEAQTLFEDGACLALTGHLAEARHHLKHGLALAEERDQLPGTIEALGWLAIVEYFSGSPSAPLPYLSRASALLTDSVSTPVGAAPALIAEALIEIDDCNELLTQSLLGRLREIVAGTEYEVFALQLESVVAGACSGPLEQLEILQAMQLAIHDWQQPALACLMHDTERASALIRLGSVGAAREAVSEIESAAIGDTSHIHCVARLAARLALHTGDYEGALAVTGGCRSLGDRHAPRALAHVDVLRSAAHDGLGDVGIAAEAMDRALLQAARTGWRRHFTTLPQDRLASMLAAAGDRDQPPAALAVLDELHDHLSPVASDSISPLSSRERVILGQIVAGQSRQQMSSQLSVSPNTIKTQVRSIYRKLGASNRHEAIDRAAKYGITA